MRLSVPCSTQIINSGRKASPSSTKTGFRWARSLWNLGSTSQELNGLHSIPESELEGFGPNPSTVSIHKMGSASCICIEMILYCIEIVLFCIEIVLYCIEIGLDWIVLKLYCNVLHCIEIVLYCIEIVLYCFEIVFYCIEIVLYCIEIVLYCI